MQKKFKRKKNIAIVPKVGLYPGTIIYTSPALKAKIDELLKDYIKEESNVLEPRNREV